MLTYVFIVRELKSKRKKFCSHLRREQRERKVAGFYEIRAVTKRNSVTAFDLRCSLPGSLFALKIILI